MAENLPPWFNSSTMDLRSPYPYWLLKHGIIHSYPSLQENVHTDIAVMGAGISGALVAYRLNQAGYDVTVVDRRHAATGSTAASTALLQYEIDTPLHKLKKMVGEKNAIRSYKLCLKAIYELERICRSIPGAGLFIEKPSLQYASYAKDVTGLQEEFKARKRAGIELEWLEERDLMKKFGFSKPAALFSHAGAEADAYRITHGILAKIIKKGAAVYDNTGIIAIHHRKSNVELITADGYKIYARKLVIACGYESRQYIPKTVQQLQSTFAIVSEPSHDDKFWYKKALIWETATPYLYMRTTADNRILVGGKDTPVTSPEKRDAMIPVKAKALEKSFSALFPAIHFKTDFKWAGNFASTRDGLPYIGSIPQRPNTYFALGFGGNGITFSVIAANMIRDKLTGRKSGDHDLFSFDR